MGGGRQCALAATLVASACAHGGPAAAPRAAVASSAPAAGLAAVSPAPAGAEAVEFARDVRPILERGCQPCHFTGGVMHAKLPFDREATVHELGEKLFTRIRHADEQTTIRTLLAAPRR